MTRPSSRAARTWRRLTQTYGARVVDAYGAACPPDWCAVIDRTDDDRLDQALIAVRQKHLQHPPTLGEFEAAIPPRRLATDASMPERLVAHVMRTQRLCHHQSAASGSYFGRIEEDGRSGGVVTRGVVVPSCSECGRPSRRVLAAGLA